MTTWTDPADHRDTEQALAVRHLIELQGLVQGVGMRPHLVRLARSVGVAGRCHNDAGGVVIEVEGSLAAVTEFEQRMAIEAPPLARIDSYRKREVPIQGQTDFQIIESHSTEGDRTLVAPDTAVCADCLRELRDPTDRRYRHPFITCTNCGPRLTITLDLPYDRPTTTMSRFTMCARCAAEYADPADRRYHAQPIACHDCGPSLEAVTADGTPQARGTEPVLALAISALRRGQIVAIKGIGGYHLACDASNRAAVAELRRRKQRPDQPFAVMTRDLDAARRLVFVGWAAELLTSPQRPIVVLPQVPTGSIADGVAPRLGELGVVLPYAPLHHLLFADQPDGSPGAPAALVMTSGNVSGEPLCHIDDEALERLGAVADLFIRHDRPIAVPVEDSVIAWHNESPVGPVLLRRSRGYAPLPIDVAVPGVGRVAAGAAHPDSGQVGSVLAVGAEVKNTVALAHSGRVFVSGHVGDLESLASRTTHGQVMDQMVDFHRRPPALITADLHPAYASRRVAVEYSAAQGVPLLEVQHHHAHLASLAAEHGRLNDSLIGLVFDGTGYGCDTTIWGGEVLRLTHGGTAFDRLGRLGAVRLPGGDAGVRNPVRVAALALLDAGSHWTGTPVAKALTRAEAELLTRCHDQGTGAIVTSSVGRLFDVVAAILGVRQRISYDAQAAIELEAVARRWRRRQPEPGPWLSSPVELPLPMMSGTLDPAPLVATLADLVRRGHDRGALAWAFHDTLARSSAALAAAAVHIGQSYGHHARVGHHSARPSGGVVGLTGGVFVNRILLERTVHHLGALGLTALTHQQVPANDGGLALGQAAIGVRRLSSF